MLLKYNYKNKVNNDTLHRAIVDYRRKPGSKDLEERLFSMFYEITNIVRTYVSAKGYNNLNTTDWNDITICAIEHVFKKLKLYNAKQKNSCFAFCYMIIFNKIRDIVKSMSFKKYVYNTRGNVMDCDFVNLGLHSNHNGTPNHISTSFTPKPLKKFNHFEIGEDGR